MTNPQDKSGTFNNNGSLPPLDVTYGTSYGDASPNTTDHVHITLTDSRDGATADADCYLRFHDEFENFNVTADYTQHGAWVRVTPGVNSGPAGGVFTQSVTVPVSVTNTSSAQYPLLMYLEGIYHLRTGTTFSTAVPRPPTAYNMPPNKWCWVEDQPFWKHREGTTDNYERQGYTGMISWTLDSAINQSNPLTDYNEKLVVSDSPPAS